MAFTMNLRRCGRRGADGNVDVIALIWLTPLVLASACLIVAAGRVSNAQQQLAYAADAAAQSAALDRAPSQAVFDAQRVAATTLNDPTWCRNGPTITVDTADFQPGGAVTVALACHVERADLYGPFMPGEQTVTARAAAVIDTYRATTP
jgi:Flp pilus assembly protein TadG